MVIGKSNKMSKIVKRCTSRVGKAEQAGLPMDVPKGHFVIYVGPNRSRYIVSISYLRKPQFQRVLQQAEEEFGFDHDMGLIVPCDEQVFQNLLSLLGDS